MDLRTKVKRSELLTKWLRYYTYHFTHCPSGNVDVMIDYLKSYGLSDGNILAKINQNYDLGKMRFAVR